MGNKIKNILVIRLSAMGDVAMTVPVISAIASQNQNAKITVLTTKFNTAFFVGVDTVELIGVDFKKEYKGMWGVFRLFLSLKASHKFDMVIDLHDVIRSKFLRSLFRMAGSKVFVVDKGRAEKSALTSSPKGRKQLKSTISRYRDTFLKAGFDIDLPAKAKRWNRELPDAIKEISPVKSGRWIGLAPFAQHLGKVYPYHLIVDMLTKLSSRDDVTVFIFGGGARERAITEALEDQFPFCHSVVGKLSIPQELDLMANLDAMISMDSLAMHMASLVGCRVVSVWGATHPYAGFLGYGQSMSDVVSVDMDCRPCSVYGNKPCRKNSYDCLYNIKPESIIERIFP